MEWNGGNGSSNGDGSTLDFLITASGLTPASLVADNNGSFFIMDVSSSNGKTGLIDFTLSSAVPLPGALVLFGSVLAGGGFFAGWRRRRDRGLA